MEDTNSQVDVHAWTGEHRATVRFANDNEYDVRFTLSSVRCTDEEKCHFCDREGRTRVSIKLVRLSMGYDDVDLTSGLAGKIRKTIMKYLDRPLCGFDQCGSSWLDLVRSLIDQPLDY